MDKRTEKIKILQTMTTMKTCLNLTDKIYNTILYLKEIEKAKVHLLFQNESQYLKFH